MSKFFLYFQIVVQYLPAYRPFYLHFIASREKDWNLWARLVTSLKSINLQMECRLPSKGPRSRLQYLVQKTVVYRVNHLQLLKHFH